MVRIEGEVFGPSEHNHATSDIVYAGCIFEGVTFWDCACTSFEDCTFDEECEFHYCVLFAFTHCVVYQSSFKECYRVCLQYCTIRSCVPVDSLGEEERPFRNSTAKGCRAVEPSKQYKIYDDVYFR